MFAGFSLASGLAQSLGQLITFRTLQGIGGSGLFSLPLIMLPELAPKRLWGLISSLIGISLACSYIAGRSRIFIHTYYQD
jgi:MFS family permease